MCSLKQQQTSVSHFSCLYCKENIVSVTGSHKSHTRALRERREVSEKRRPRHVHNLRYFEYPKTSRSFSTTDFSVPLRAASEVGMMTFSEEGLDTESSLELGRKVRRQIQPKVESDSLEIFHVCYNISFCAEFCKSFFHIFFFNLTKDRVN